MNAQEAVALCRFTAACCPSQKFDEYLARVLSNPVARAAFERAQQRPIPLRIDGTEYRRRRNRR